MKFVKRRGRKILGGSNPQIRSVLVCRPREGDGKGEAPKPQECDKVPKIGSLPPANFRPRSARREQCHHEGESVGDAHNRLTLLVRSGC